MSERSQSGPRALDPPQVRLPHGCEVTLRHEVVVGRQRLAMGTVGRVTGWRSPDELEVSVPGRGAFDLARSDVVPRTDGQLRSAIRQARVEQALGPCVLARATVGSRAWGLANERSDVDTRGVLLWPFPWASARGRPPDVVVSRDGSHTLWEVGRAIEQALRADPNTLEMLFVPDVEFIDPLGRMLFEARDAFVSTRIYGSFGRYALAQSKKLRQSLRLARHRTCVLEWLDADPDSSLDAVAAQLAVATADPALGDADGGHHRAKQYLKQLYRSMFDQGLLTACSFASLAEFARTRPAELALPRELRPKNAYNLLRIVSCAVHWLRTGTPIIETHGSLRDRLLEIKGGRVDLDTALRWTDEIASDLEEARDRSVLPSTPDFATAQAVLLRLREAAARRWLSATSGPWGADAPAVPCSDHA